MIKIKKLNHRYNNRKENAVRDVSLHIRRGENVAIIGSSGSGKSTLLKCMNKLIEPTSGNILINDEDIINANKNDVNRIRSKIGMIFQNFNLIERNTVLSNVLNGRLSYNNSLSTLFGRFSKEDHLIANENLKRVGLTKHTHEKVMNLSGGQKQRVAIARALSQQPNVILADEPVSSLDPKLMKEIMDLLGNICKEKNITLVVSLHFLDFAKKFSSRIIGMRDGKIVFDDEPAQLTEKDVVDIYGKTKDWYLYGKAGF